MKHFVVYLLDGHQVRIEAQEIKFEDETDNISFWNGAQMVAGFISYAGWERTS